VARYSPPVIGIRMSAIRAYDLAREVSLNYNPNVKNIYSEEAII
jgi:hypothetical protein